MRERKREWGKGVEEGERERLRKREWEREMDRTREWEGL